MRIGIFGGSFNPIHEGHLKLAREALSELNLKKIYFVPSYQNPLKSKEELLPSSVRVRLIRRTIRRNPAFQLSRCELSRKGFSYTIDTLRYFRRKFGPKTVFYFLSGADTLVELKKWKSLDEVLGACRFVVMTRPGYSFSAPENIKRRIFEMPFDALPISSTRIRQQSLKNKGMPASKRIKKLH